MANVRNRLSKEKWLEKSLEVLVLEGDRKLTIDHLVKAMGVTKGSFYWHFKNRADFITSLVCYWVEEYTLSLTSQIKAEFPDANKRLLALLKRLTETNHARYDFAVLYWGQYEPAAKAMVQEAMDFRLNYIRSIFKELGFKGDELEMRVQTVVTFQTMELHDYNNLTKEERLRHVKLRHRMLTRK